MQRIYDKAFADGRKSVAATADFSNIGGSSFHAMACEIQHKAYGRLSPKEGLRR